MILKTSSACYSARYYGARGGRKKKVEPVEVISESNAIK